MEQLGLGQLHWSTANYQPLQERALWDGLLALYDQVMNFAMLANLAQYNRSTVCSQSLHYMTSVAGAIPLSWPQVLYMMISSPFHDVLVLSCLVKGSHRDS